MARFLKITIIIIILFFSLQPPVDLDLGWHLRYGEYFWQTGQVLKDNILSVVWPDYAWVQASWGYDLIVYQLFTRFNFFSLSLSASVISLLIFWLLTRPWSKQSPVKLFFLATVLLTQATLIFASGLRAQTLSALMFTLMLIFINPLSTPRSLARSGALFLPILFLFWANLHGGFALGLIITTILLLPHLRQSKIALALILSWLVPLVNPRSINLYQEAFNHSTNANLNIISEWMPVPLTSVVAIISILVFILVVIMYLHRRRHLQDLPYMLAFLIVTYLAFTALRFMIQYGIMATYYLSRALPSFKLPRATSAIIIASLIGLMIFDATTTHYYFVAPRPQLLQFSWADYCQPLLSYHRQVKDCSEEITAVMLANPPAGEAGFHPYNYGGYLSWRVPQVKTFVDGRMASWQDHGRTPPVIEGDQVFLDKTPLTWRKFDSQYHFNWAIIPTHTSIVSYLDTLVTAGLWTRPYQDQFYTYYVKN